MFAWKCESCKLTLAKKLSLAGRRDVVPPGGLQHSKLVICSCEVNARTRASYSPVESDVGDSSHTQMILLYR